MDSIKLAKKTQGSSIGTRVRMTLRAVLIGAISTVALAATDAAAGATVKGVSGDVSFSGSREYVVLYKRGVDLSTQLQSEVRKGNEVENRYTSSVNGALLELEAADVNRLRDDSRVLVLEKNRRVSIAAQTQGTRSAPSWGLDRVDQRNLPLNGTISTTREGQGVEAYIIDTGIRLDHTQFTGRVNPEGFSAFPGGWNDCQGHGTHVAGTVAGSTYGVAPSARVTAVRVLGCDGSGSYAGVIDGIDWVVSDHRAGEAAVANMSLGGGRSDGVNVAVQRAIDDGVSMVVAAGNETSDACGRSPASAPNAVTVGSSTRTDAASDFSNYGRCVDLYAPGSDIVSADYSSPTATSTKSGTSMAAPHIAGVASLLLSGQPTMTPTEVTNRLVASSSPDRLTGLNGCTANLLAYAGAGADLPVPPNGPGGPPNDNFGNRQALTSLSGVSGETGCATRESGEPSHGSGSSASIWYTWTAPQEGTLVLRTQGSSYDTLLAAYSGSSLGSLNQIAQNDDYGALWSQISFPVTAGASYQIAIDGWQGASGRTLLSGSFTSTNPGPPPPGDPGDPNPRPTNDDFTDRHSISLSLGASGSTVGATAESGEPAHYQQARASVWHRWTAPETGTVVFDTSGSSFDTTMAAYSGSSLQSLTRLASDDDSGDGATSRISFAVSAGESYSIAIDGYEGRTGSFSLAGAMTAPPTNPGPPPPGNPGDGFGSGSVRGLTGSPSDGRYEFTVSASTNRNICDGSFCGWYPLAVALPQGEQCNPDGTGGTLAWVGDYASDPATQTDRDVMYLDATPPFKFCIYIYASPTGQLDYHLIHETVLAPEGWQEAPAVLPRPSIASGPARRTSTRTARFVVRGLNGAGFQCRLDGRRYWSSCSSPRTYRRLEPGGHVFRVRQTANDAVSPATEYRWRIVRTGR